MQVSPAPPLSYKKVNYIFHYDIHKYKQTKQTSYLSKQLPLLLLILLKKKSD